MVNKLKDTETYHDTDTRLKETTGMVIGAEYDYRKCAVKAPCFSCGDIRRKKNLANNNTMSYITKNFSMRGE